MKLGNEQTVKAFIEEQNAKALTVEWVIWALNLIADANDKNVRLNPDWLRASPWNSGVTFLSGDDEPPMIYE